MANEIPVVFYIESSYNYHFLIKELANGLKGQLENTEKYKTFSFPIEKEKNDKTGNEDIITISYKIKFIDCA